MAKKKGAKKAVEEESCKMDGNCTCSIGMLKIAVIAFTLFIVTVWPAVGNWLIGVPWWVYLIIFVVFGAGAMGTNKKCWCWKKK